RRSLMLPLPHQPSAMAGADKMKPVATAPNVTARRNDFLNICDAPPRQAALEAERRRPHRYAYAYGYSAGPRTIARGPAPALRTDRASCLRDGGVLNARCFRSGLSAEML